MKSIRRDATGEALPEKGRSTWELFWSRDQIPDPGKRKNDILSRHKRPMAVLGRMMRKYWLLVLIFALATWAYLNPTMLNVLLLAVTFIGRLAFAMVYMIIQFGAIFWFMSRSKVVTIRPEDPKNITFDDYWGQPNLKALVRQWMSLLSDRDEFVQMGGEYINGLLLYGEPGTGKTMLAKAMAGEAGVSFLSIEGSGFRAMFWGVDVLKMIWFVSKARKLAREYGACIAYIDEIDAVGMSRGGVMGRGGMPGGTMGGGGMMGMGGGTGALTRLLYEMDGVGDQTRTEKLRAKIYQLLRKKAPPRDWHVLFMGSTNRPDVLDPALTRPGRFDQMIHVGLPDKAGRREIINGYLGRIKHDDSVDVEALVSNTSRSTPAQIMAAITKDSVRIALFEGRKRVNQMDIENAFLQQWTGIENPIEEMDPEQRRQIAVHEAGHAVAQHYLMPDQRIVHLTIVARAQALGFMLPLDEIEVYAQPLRRLVADVMVAMGGHVATRIVFGEYWTGAYSDFNSVRAQLNHLRLLGYFGPPVGDVGFGDKEGKGDDVLKRFWVRLEQQVEQLLQDHYDELIALTDALLERKSLSNQDVLALLGSNSRQLKAREKAAADLAAADGREQEELPALPEPEARSDNGKEDEEEEEKEKEKEPEVVPGD